MISVGFGPIESINRFESAKPESTTAKASGSPESSSTLFAAKPEKSFKKILEQSSERETSKRSSSKNEEIAGAVGTSAAPVQSQNRRQPPSTDEKPTPAVDRSPGAVAADVAASEPLIQGENETPETGLEQIDERVNSIVENLEQTAETELSMRHISMRDFLGKMKSEFGVEPQSIVKAFANLDEKALTAPPDQTAEAVLSQLALKPEELPIAQKFYREMLNQTGESALNETLVGVGAGVSLKVLSEQDIAFDKLQKSISGLNDSFAMRSPPLTKEPTVSTVVTSPASLASPKAEASIVVPVAAEEQTVNPNLIATETAQQEAQLNVVPEADLAELAPKSVAEPANKESSSSKFAAIGAALSAAASSLQSATSANTSGKNSDSDSSQSETGSQTRNFSSIESALQSTGFELPVTGERAAVPLAAGTSTAAAMAASVGSSITAGTAGASAGSADSTANAQELVRHAQILMKNGGGEMKMQLKPEGVGEVTLKVSVKDGHVAVQMLTESDSAKKLLESNLDDLKTSLAQHKLHVDAMKIEVGTEFAKQRFEQAQQDASREQARQMAQDFMGQFRNDREGFRQGFSETLGFKNYQQQPRKNPLPEIEPVGDASVSQTRSNSKSTSDRRLNLVA